ncbi:undecaprenyl-diphosphatase UppP [Ignavibacterium sp.]|uniref:undecaprenyl-diphosphatase UppP n=1 Tax=Ignavibacterium sp. TaxID=2651167 RepID=UPI002202C0BD|nr:undecaprenyl-diphosphatase UppP [Ignavibacterium sp.]BDQ04134.1 MAG: undecaprenyl-diphosphatase [Ignavibacterium sp.]
MNFLDAAFLGLIQGLTEFLPISSTGHLTLAGKLLNLISEEHPEHWTAFIAVIQLGTLLAVLIYFFNDLIAIVRDFVNDNLINRKKFISQNLNSKLGWLIIVGTIPIVVIGLLFKDQIEGAFTKNLYVISSSLIILALILFVAEKISRFKKDISDVTVFDSIMIGIAQAVSLIPGSSRSGTTITAGLFLGLKRDVAARFSFLLSVPAVLASGLLQLYEASSFINNAMILNMIIATIVSAVSGYIAIDFLIKFLKKNSTMVFIIYRIILGISILILISQNIIKP